MLIPWELIGEKQGRARHTARAARLRPLCLTHAGRHHDVAFTNSASDRRVWRFRTNININSSPTVKLVLGSETKMKAEPLHPLPHWSIVDRISLGQSIIQNTRLLHSSPFIEQTKHCTWDIEALQAHGLNGSLGRRSAI